MSHQRLIPACASTASFFPRPGEHFQVEPLTTATGPNGGEANPGSFRVLASIRAWRVYDEYLRAFGGFVVWVDNMETYGPCVKQREWAPFIEPNVAKLVGPDLRYAVFDPPELGGGQFVGFAAGVCADPISSPRIRVSETTVQYRFGTEMYRSCLDDTQTENQIFVHELAHLYHLDHVTSVASVMNATSNAAHPCRTRAKHVAEAKPDGELMAAIWDDLWTQRVLGTRRPAAFDVSGSGVTGSGASPFREQSLRVMRGNWLFTTGVVHFSLINLIDDVSAVDVEILAAPTPINWEPNVDGEIDVSGAVPLGTQRFGGPLTAGNHQRFVSYALTNTGLAVDRDYWIVLRVSQPDGPEFDPTDNLIYTRHRVRVLQ